MDLQGLTHQEFSGYSVDQVLDFLVDRKVMTTGQRDQWQSTFTNGNCTGNSVLWMAEMYRDDPNLLKLTQLISWNLEEPTRVSRGVSTYLAMVAIRLLRTDTNTGTRDASQTMYSNPRIDRAERIHAAILRTDYTLKQCSTFGDDLLLLPFPFAGKKVPTQTFTILNENGDARNSLMRESTPHFHFYGRTKFEELYKTTQELSSGIAGISLYVHGTHGFGKSHMLAALVTLLIKEGRKVLYLPDYRRFAKCPLFYLQHSLLLTFSGDRETQKKILLFRKIGELVEWCCGEAANPTGEMWIVIIDQINILDTHDESADSVSPSSRMECAKYIAAFKECHFLIYAASGNYQYGHAEAGKSGVQDMVLNGGLDKDEMGHWWRIFGSKMKTVIADDRRLAFETLTGNVPAFLHAAAKIKAQVTSLEKDKDKEANGGGDQEIPEAARLSEDDMLWGNFVGLFVKCGPILHMQNSIAQFFAKAIGRNRDFAARSRYEQACLACVAGPHYPPSRSQLPSDIDWRYFYVRSDNTADSSCLLARQYLTGCLRNELRPTEFQTTAWRTAMASEGPRNDLVLGYFTEQVLLADIVLKGLSFLGDGWNGPYESDTFTGIKPTIDKPTGRKKTEVRLYVPEASNHEGIDAVVIRIDKRKTARGKPQEYHFTVVPIQITIAKSHSDSEKEFFDIYEEYTRQFEAMGFASTTVSIIFLWIVESIPGTCSRQTTQKAGRRTLYWRTEADHPGYERCWATVAEVSHDVGALLRKARGRSWEIGMPPDLTHVLARNAPEGKGKEKAQLEEEHFPENQEQSQVQSASAARATRTSKKRSLDA